MTEPFIGEIQLFGFNFNPRGWAFCNGPTLPISQNTALFSLLGTTFGGNGQVNFALPDLRGRVPIHVGNSHTLGERSGEQAHTLSIAEMPTHTHVMHASTAATDTQGLPTNTLLAPVNNMYRPPTTLTPMQPASVTNVGGSQAHLNMQPFLTLSFCIALQGIFPSQN